jgi:hypothetical protein
VDGYWGSFGILRPPTADAKISTTAFAIRALRDFAPPARKAEFDERIAKAVAWVSRFEPTTTEDVVSQLLGLKWGGADAALIDRTAKRLLALERADGGWAQTPHLQSDAFATGTALYALNEGHGRDGRSIQEGSRVFAVDAGRGWVVVRGEPGAQVPALFRGRIPVSSR